MSEKVPEISAWLAITVAAVAIRIAGTSNPAGTRL
jgi:hypothetical protein